MEIIKKDKYSLVEAKGDSVVDFSSDLTKRHEEFKTENLVIDLGKYENLELEELLGFLELSNLHRSENKSFVIINKTIPIDKIPDELIVVPTLPEAEDMVQMDEIQRELGF